MVWVLPYTCLQSETNAKYLNLVCHSRKSLARGEKSPEPINTIGIHSAIIPSVFLIILDKIDLSQNLSSDFPFLQNILSSLGLSFG